MPNETNEAFPGVLFHCGKERLMCFQPRGYFDKEAVSELVKLIEKMEDAAEAPFNRFTDTSRLDAIDLDLEFVYDIALHRRRAYADGPRVKSAFYTISTAATRVIELHARVTKDSGLQVKCFDDLDTAALWLGVSRRTLEM